jgi:DNA-binding transcriptional regulator PaaX
VKVVVGILGVAALAGATVIMPVTPIVVTPILKFIKEEQEKLEEIKNHKFDKVRLWVLLRRLEKQKEVTWETLPDGSVAVKLTEKGKAKHLKYKLDEMEENFSKRSWDGKWRIIVFDVPEIKRVNRDAFRRFIKHLKFYQLQKSVYLTPYPCEDEVKYLRYYFDLGDNVQMLVTNDLENDAAYRLYFGLT